MTAPINIIIVIIINIRYTKVHYEAPRPQTKSLQSIQQAIQVTGGNEYQLVTPQHHDKYLQLIQQPQRYPAVVSASNILN